MNRKELQIRTDEDDLALIGHVGQAALRYTVGMRTLLVLGIFGFTAACSGGSKNDENDGNGTEVDARIDANVVDAIQGPQGTYSGTVRTGSGGTVAGATLRVWQSERMTTADADGNFSFNVPTGLQLIVAQAPNHWGRIFTVYLDDRQDYSADVFLSPDDDFAGVMGALGHENDASKGVVEIFFSGVSGSGGESATIDPTGDVPYTFNSDGVLAAPAGITTTSEPILIFPNVPTTTSTVSVTPVGADGVNTCVRDFEILVDWPLMAHTFTTVTATCTAL